MLQEVILQQFEAALAMLSTCIEQCPDEAWNRPVANLKFCQAAFHVLFYTDYYLGPDEAAFRTQAYHGEHADVFRDYEELEDREQRLTYSKAAALDYLAHCRQKLPAALASETAESLAAPCGFARWGMSRAELYVYNMRHVQHHAAQLSLRLRLDYGVDVPWLGRSPAR